jgi:hypothetical protein
MHRRSTEQRVRTVGEDLSLETIQRCQKETGVPNGVHADVIPAAECSTTPKRHLDPRKPLWAGHTAMRVGSGRSRRLLSTIGQRACVPSIQTLVTPRR